MFWAPALPHNEELPLVKLVDASIKNSFYFILPTASRSLGTLAGRVIRVIGVVFLTVRVVLSFFSFRLCLLRRGLGGLFLESANKFWAFDILLKFPCIVTFIPSLPPDAILCAALDHLAGDDVLNFVLVVGILGFQLGVQLFFFALEDGIVELIVILLQKLVAVERFLRLPGVVLRAIVFPSDSVEDFTI
jgi:hypothetical protein